MADGDQAPQPGPDKDEGFSLFKPSEWGHFVWNWFVRWPGIRKFRGGRVVAGGKEGGRKHPLFYEIEYWWLEKNKDLYEKLLIPVEKFWTVQSHHMGFGVRGYGNKEGNITGNPKGIVPIYKELGPYSDIDRTVIETEWFRNGSGTKIKDRRFKIPDDTQDWDPYWNVEMIRKFKAGILKPKKERKTFIVDLMPGTVFHEGKKELKEELHVFGHTNVQMVSDSVEDVNQMYNIRGLQQRQIPVETRTQFNNASSAIKKLLARIQEIEHETYKELHELEGSVRNYRSAWNVLYKEQSPDTKDLAVMRFKHTYRVIKQYFTEEIEEIIEEKDARGNVIDTERKKRKVPMYLEPRDIYEEEKDGIKKMIEGIKDKKTTKLAKITAILSVVENLIRQPDTFKDMLNKIIQDKSPELRAIIESDEDNDTKIFKINGLLRHDDPSFDELVGEFFDNIKFELNEVLGRQGLDTEQKLNAISDLILNSMKLTVIIKNDLLGLSEEIKGIFYPAYEDIEDKQEKTRSEDEIFGLLRDTIATRYKTKGSAIIKIFEEKEAEIRQLINTKKDTVNVDESHDRLVEIILNEIGKYENEIAGIKLKEEELKNNKDNIDNEFKQESKELESRLKQIGNIINKDTINTQLTRKNDNFHKRPEEVEIGLDENGYPLEIDPKTGEVLIDKWWNELRDNPWQLETIASKPGGADLLRAHLGATVDVSRPEGERVRDRGPRREERKIIDERFHDFYDLLETGALMFGYWDAVRDDLRDGRYHNHSKSAADYVIEGMGGFDEKKGAPYRKSWINFWRQRGLTTPRIGNFPFKKTGVHGVEKMLVHATPDHFTTEKNPESFTEDQKEMAKLTVKEGNLLKEEEKVTRKYRMKMKDGSFYPPPDSSGKIQWETRRPNKYNPAFDRRAEGLKNVFWGNMYYYRWSGYAKEWSENPFPHISTRGIALYISYLAATDAYYYREAEEILENRKFDYGVRGQGMHGNINPLSGEGILQEN
tara:strand:- start:231 stop:3209 length:2979 start_codon:yes stop_codon:yes gene_type:complete